MLIHFTSIEDTFCIYSLQETKAREAQLTADERRRNMQSLATMYVHPSHPLAEVVKDMDERYSHLSAKDRIETEEALDPQKYALLKHKFIMSNEADLVLFCDATLFMQGWLQRVHGAASRELMPSTA